MVPLKVSLSRPTFAFKSPTRTIMSPLGIPCILLYAEATHNIMYQFLRLSLQSHLLAPPPCRAGPSPWLALWYGMVSHWLSGHFLEYSPRNSFSNLKQHYSASLGLGALLSSPA